MKNEELTNLMLRNTARNLTSLFTGLLQLLMGILWVIAVLTNLSVSPLVTAIGIVFIMANLMNFANYVRAMAKESTRRDKWEEIVEERMIEKCFERFDFTFGRTCYAKRCKNAVSGTEVYCSDCRLRIEI